MCPAAAGGRSGDVRANVPPSKAPASGRSSAQLSSQRAVTGPEAVGIANQAPNGQELQRRGALEPAVRVRAVAEARAALLHTAKDCQTGCQERPRPASTRRQLLASTRAGLALITNQMRRMGQPKRWLSVKPTAQHADVATICEGRQAGQARMGPRKPLPSWEQKDSASATAQRPRAGPLQAQAHQHPAPVPRKHMPAACQWALSVLPSRPCIYTLVSTMPWQLPGTDPFPHRLAQPAGLLGAQQHSVHHGGGGIQRHEQRDERQHLQGKRGASKAGDQEGKGAHARGSCL